MKRTERHHLKKNEIATSVARVREAIEIYHKPIVAVLIAIALVVVAVVAVTAWRRGSDTDARQMLADAMLVASAPVAPPPAAGTDAPASPAPGTYATERAKLEAALPKFVAAAEAHPSSEAGIAARYHAGAILAALGRQAEAEQRYREVIDRAGSGLYGRMARLGMANTKAAAGQYDEAIATYKELSEQKDTELPVDGVLMQLGRTYVQAGKPAEARQAFQRIIDEFPQSPYASLATRELAQAKS
ncbi:MAG TPA: tetratricopeptide repeat protein [Vicinamibacterales bacterium]|nr:tetratricopeptide repeat protein [Vicinamibacterales bacterium]